MNIYVYIFHPFSFFIFKTSLLDNNHFLELAQAQTLLVASLWTQNYIKSLARPDCWDFNVSQCHFSWISVWGLHWIKKSVGEWHNITKPFPTVLVITEQSPPWSYISCCHIGRFHNKKKHISLLLLCIFCGFVFHQIQYHFFFLHFFTPSLTTTEQCLFAVYHSLWSSAVNLWRKR